MPQQRPPLLETFAQQLAEVQQHIDASMTQLLETHRLLTAGHIFRTATQQHPRRDAWSRLPENNDFTPSAVAPPD